MLHLEFVYVSVWAETVEELQEAAAELVRMNVDLLFATSSAETERAKRATKTIPYRRRNACRPCWARTCASLPRPGGNITGLSVQLTESNDKQLEILQGT